MKIMEEVVQLFGKMLAHFQILFQKRLSIHLFKIIIKPLNNGKS